MQSFGTSFGDSKLSVLLALVVAVIAIAVVIYLYRLTFARQLHLTGGRSRQPRLGVVDAFDLDRQRQLILVRRDNVEHLLMIGGPNDLVIESAFVRGAPMAAVPPGRDKEAGAALPAAPTVPASLSPSGPAPSLPAEHVEPDSSTPRLLDEMDNEPAPPMPVPPPAPQVERPAPVAERVVPPPTLPSPVSPGDLGLLADLPAPGPVTAAPPGPVAATGPAELTTAPEPPPSARPMLNRPFAPPPRPPGSSLPPRPPLSSLRPSTSAPRPAASAPPPNRPAPFTPLQRGTSAASLRREPVVGSAPPPTGPAPTGTAPTGAAPGAPAIPPGGDAPRAPLPPLPPASGFPPAGGLPLPDARPPRAPDSRQPGITLESIESLEEEMAKLLGRGSSPEKR